MMQTPHLQKLKWLALLFVLGCTNNDSAHKLSEIQRQIYAQPEITQEEIVAKIEHFYRSLTVTDSIRQSVEQAVARQLATAPSRLGPFSEKIRDEQNPYRLENILQEIIRAGLMARALLNVDLSDSLFVLAVNVAHEVDSTTATAYWVGFVSQSQKFTTDDVHNWLMVSVARDSCYKYHGDDTNWPLAEQYAALALQRLEKTPDTRIKLDVMFRLQYILREFYSYFPLTIAISKYYYQMAQENGYHLRAVAMAFQEADASREDGKIQEALDLLKSIIKETNKYNRISDMEWFKRMALLRLAECYRALGDYQNAKSACAELEQLAPDQRKLTLLHIVKGRIHQNLGEYEQAHAEYDAGLSVADAQGDMVNMSALYTNLGTMYEFLTEYDRAQDYFIKSEALLKSPLLSRNDRVRLILNSAEIAALQGKEEQFDQAIREANELMTSANLPFRLAQYYRTIGALNFQLGRNEEALEYLKKAIGIFRSEGLVPKFLGTTVDIVKCLMALSEYSKAMQALEELRNTANKVSEPERVIDALALEAEIAFRLGDRAKAVVLSNQVCQHVQKVMDNIQDEAKRIFYHQKNYKYLKNSVFYGIQNNTLNLSLQKLNQIKSITLPSTTLKRPEYLSSANGSDSLPPVQSFLDSTNCIIDYIVTHDSLFAVVFSGQKSKSVILRKHLPEQKLASTTRAYKMLIEKTTTIFENFNVSNAQEHYRKTTQQAHELYSMLFGWPALDSLVQESEMMYIVPDEYLYDLPFATLVVDTTESITYLANETATVILPGHSLAPKPKMQSNPLDGNGLISMDITFDKAAELLALLKQLSPDLEELSVNSLQVAKAEAIEQLRVARDYYFFLGHGFAHAQNPDLSYIELSVTSSEQKKNIIQISMPEFREHKLVWDNKPTILLLGCKTATGKSYMGSGTLGFQRGLLSMGAGTVVGTLWDIDSNHAIPDMAEVLKNWQKNGNFTRALQQSQIRKIEQMRKDPVFKQPHPYFWGGFMVTSVI